MTKFGEHFFVSSMTSGIRSLRKDYERKSDEGRPPKAMMLVAQSQTSFLLDWVVVGVPVVHLDFRNNVNLPGARDDDDYCYFPGRVRHAH